MVGYSGISKVEFIKRFSSIKPIAGIRFCAFGQGDWYNCRIAKVEGDIVYIEVVGKA